MDNRISAYNPKYPSHKNIKLRIIDPTNVHVINDLNLNLINPHMIEMGQKENGIDRMRKRITSSFFPPVN